MPIDPFFHEFPPVIVDLHFIFRYLCYIQNNNIRQEDNQRLSCDILVLT